MQSCQKVTFLRIVSKLTVIGIFWGKKSFFVNYRKFGTFKYIIDILKFDFLLLLVIGNFTKRPVGTF